MRVSKRSLRRLNLRKAISSPVALKSMDRQTECFVCLGLIVILLQNTGRSQAECSKRYTDSPGLIADSLLKDTAHRSDVSSSHTSTCRYRICAPPDHFIVLNITRLEGAPHSSSSSSSVVAATTGFKTSGRAATDGSSSSIGSTTRCLPQVLVKNVARSGKALALATLCDDGEEPLPHLVHSHGNELRVVFRSPVWQSSHFQATYTFHKKPESPPCLACPLVQERAKSMNASSTLLPQNDSHSGQIEHGAEEGSTSSSGALHMEYFVLVVLAPLTVVCLCCVIMFYYRRSSRLASHAPPSLPTSSYSITSDSPQVPVSQSPLISSHRFSAQHQQERLRKQREAMCPPRSESVEKFPTSVCLLDEDEPQHMRDNIRIHREVMSENGIRAPPNRTVYDSERQDFMIHRGKTTMDQHQQATPSHQQRHAVRRSASGVSSSSTSSTKRGGVGGVGRGSGGVKGATVLTQSPTTTTTASATAMLLRGSGGSPSSLEAVIDSETRSPLNLVDSDSEGPPPYASLIPTTATTTNNINVCDNSTDSTSSNGLLQSQERPQQQPLTQLSLRPCSPPCQPNSNARYQSGGTRGASRGSGVRLKHEGADCV